MTRPGRTVEVGAGRALPDAPAGGVPSACPAAGGDGARGRGVVGALPPRKPAPTIVTETSAITATTTQVRRVRDPPPPTRTSLTSGSSGGDIVVRRAVAPYAIPRYALRTMSFSRRFSARSLSTIRPVSIT